MTSPQQKPINSRSKRVRKPAPLGRTSLACATCRNRKVKCSGDWPRCRACIRRADICEYPGIPTQRNGGQEEGGDGEETHFMNVDVDQQRILIMPSSAAGNEFSSTSGGDSNLPPIGILANAAETFFSLFGEFPFWFFRRHIFMEELVRGLVPPPLLHCILSVVARFVTPCYELYGGTVEASVHFAVMARKEMARMHDDISILNIHCNLILGLYEFGHGDEHRAWIRIGIATRLCQVLGLSSESSYRGDDNVTAEVKRRVYWSCFVIERLLVNGRDRPLHDMPTAKKTANLPSSTADFIVGRDGNKDTTKRLECGPSTRDTLQAFTVRIADLLSRIVEWGGGGVGGRHEDPRLPWLDDMPFSQLKRELQQWRSCLPHYLILNGANIRAHVEANEGKLFGIMHLLYMTAGVRLYRKYVPFIPPPSYDLATDGPSDGPELMPGPESPGFWREIARLGFSFATGITAALVQLSEHGLAPWNTPLAGLALVESSSMHIFALHGNWSGCEEFVGMPAKAMLTRNLRLLIKVQENWPVVAFWIKSLRLFYERVSISQSAVLSTGNLNQPPLDTIKEAMLHFNHSSREKEGLPNYLPQKQHDLFGLLEEEILDR